MTDELLVLSPSLTYHEHHGAYYVYHNAVGYLLKMSHDVLEFLEAFREPMRAEAAVAHFDGKYPADMVREFAKVFRRHMCLLGATERWEDNLWAMFPVVSRWAVYHAPADRSAPMRFVNLGPDRAVHSAVLEDWERTLWEAIDGNKTVSALLAEVRVHPQLREVRDLRERFLSTIQRWVALDLQVLRLSEYPVSMYKQQPHLRQPYLSSVMPYRRYEMGTPVRPSLEEARIVTPREYYRAGIGDAEAQFDDAETTLSHLFRAPHPALGGKPFGARMAEALLDRGRLPESVHDVVEVGGGLGWFARAFLGELGARRPLQLEKLDYRILDLSPALQAAQRETLADLPVRFVEGDAEALELPAASVDLVLCNEMVGDLEAIRLTRAELGFGFDEGSEPTEESEEAAAAMREERLKKLGEPGALLLKYDLPLRDAPPEFYVNTGLFRYMERLWDVLRPGGTAVLTEFGEEYQYPLLSLHLDHPELSIHFGHAKHVARRIGFDVEFSFVIDLLDFQRDLKTLAATRTSFLALRELVRGFGVELDKVAYTEEMLRAALGDKVPLEELHDLRFEPIEDRCMGLVPHQFKALILHKPE